jgi:5-methyltetrahydropteroyltriglutamate--homocysteine methyltransferase
MAFTYRFHKDHIGSLLRPASLIEARRRLAAGMIEREELHEVENDAIVDAVKLQKSAGLDLFTDGEFRREDFRSGLIEATEGFEARDIEMPWHGPTGTVVMQSTAYFVTDKLVQKRRIAEGHTEFMRTLTQGHLKYTLIAPGFLAERCWKDGVTDRVYGSREELASDIVEITRKEIEALFAEGVIYVQLDNPGYADFLAGGHSTDDPEALERMLAADAATVSGIERPEGGTLGLHVCRGNRDSLWMSEGDYEPIAEKLFGTVDVDRFLLEYDDERSGGFDQLRYIPEGKRAVLGLISTKTPELEDVYEMVGQIDEAAKFMRDIDDLSVSPQCGFASVSTGGNALTVEDERKKLALVTDVAFSTWGFEA